MARRKKRLTRIWGIYLWGMLTVIVLLLAGFAVVDLLREGAGMLLSSFGLVTETSQNIFYIMAAIVVLFISGYGISRIVNSLFGK